MRQQSTLRFPCEPAGVQDLAGLRAFYAKFFGSDIPELAAMQSWHSRNPEIFWLLYRVARPRPGAETRDLVGSFKVCPVNQTCVELLEREEVSGTTLPTDTIVAIEEATALYVGDVAAADTIARGHLVYYLNHFLGIAKNLGLSVYARPLRDDGLRLMTNYGFRPVAALNPNEPFGRIHKLVPQQATPQRPNRGKRIRGPF